MKFKGTTRRQALNQGVYTRTHIYMHIHTCTCNAHIHMYMHTHVHTCICMHVHTYTQMFCLVMHTQCVQHETKTVWTMKEGILLQSEQGVGKSRIDSGLWLGHCQIWALNFAFSWWRQGCIYSEYSRSPLEWLPSEPASRHSALFRDKNAFSSHTLYF